MARISDDDIRRVREATDLVQVVGEQVVLKQKGRLFWGCCPFHNEKTPSFKIDPATQLWHCFGCGKGGDVFGYLMEAEKLEFPEAVRLLADRAHIEITEEGGPGISRSERQRIMEASAAAEEFYHTQLMRSKDEGAAQARAYLHERGFGSGPSKNWRLGYAPGRGQLVRHLHQLGFTRDELIKADLARVGSQGRLTDRFYERVMFPVHDLQGRTIAFGGRVIGRGEPKYLNTSETPVFHKSSNMFGIENAKSSIVASATAVVVEGYTDVIALHEAGITNVVATLGTALTAQHVKLLGRFARTIVYLFDGDAAGQKAADRASEFIDWSSAVESSREPIELKVAVLADGMDPAEFVAAKGADALRQQIEGAQPLLRFSINRRLDAYDLSKPELKARAMEDALSVLLPIRDSISANDYVNLVADRLNLDYANVSRVLKEMRAPAAARRDEEPAAHAPAARQVNTAVSKALEEERHVVWMERELISLVVADPSVLDEIGKDFICVSWTDASAAAMADALTAMDPSANAAQAYAAVQGSCPEAPQLLAESMSDAEPGPESLFRAQLLLRALDERDIERRIRADKMRLRDEKGLDPAEADRLFAEVVDLQRRLAALRASNAAGPRI